MIPIMSQQPGNRPAAASSPASANDCAATAAAPSAPAADTGDTSMLHRAEPNTRLAGVLAERAPSATGHLPTVLTSTRDQQEMAIVGGDDDPFTGELPAVTLGRSRPEVSVAVGDPGDPDPAIPLLRDRPAGPDGTPGACLCRGFVCDAPVSGPEALRSLIT